MATYAELFGLQNDNDLIEKIVVAVAVAGDTIRTEDVGTANHANRLVWAKAAFEDPRSVGKKTVWAVLAANKSNTTAQITGATDAQIQTAVDDVVDVLAGS
jgi:hypothetical protein